ncbi:PepSY-associated TM helix domain-containing protein [Lacibacterium aquatile]|uniref:PepSY-associated TM helix domain-containing protein n=1 Tax=Lacibacterium aquatile TaxID=1168082 RepID=A0ABW5DPP3_9PROT
MTPVSATATGSPTMSSLYRAVWRWHFYAGLLVLPFLMVLAITGGLYLFKDEIENTVYRDLKQVEQRASAPMPASRLIEAAMAAQAGTALKITMPATPTASAEVTVGTDAGKIAVYVDPYDAKVLGSLPDRGTIMWTIRRLHSLDFFGPIANGAIEIAGGWSILLVLTGIYLWWPRGQSGGVVTVRTKAARRTFWRDIHAVTGAFVGVFILFLAITGMPWSIVWGDRVNEWANSANFGYPEGVYVGVPISDEHAAHVTGTSTWSTEQARMPLSTGDGGKVGVDTIVAQLATLKIAPGYALALPKGSEGVYSATVYPDDVTGQRIVHLDQYTGEPLIDMSYADYGVGAKAMEWGISVHMGQEYGLTNQIVLAVACLGMVLLSVSAGVMWWKRRPAGSLGVPPMPREKRLLWGVLAILAVGGILYPLVGASLIVIVLIDMLLFQRGGRRAMA